MRCATRDDDADDDEVGADEILSSDDDGLDEYLKDADELVMSPLANVSNRTEMTCVGNLVENIQVQDEDLRPARDLAKETFAQKAARKALERQEKEKRSKHRIESIDRLSARRASIRTLSAKTRDGVILESLLAGDAGITSHCNHDLPQARLYQCVVANHEDMCSYHLFHDIPRQEYLRDCVLQNVSGRV